MVQDGASARRRAPHPADSRTPSAQPAPPEPPEQLPPASTQARLRLGGLVVGVTLVAVLLTAADAPPSARSLVVLLAATLLPGYPLVARLPVDLPTLVALDVCASLTLEGALTFVLVQTGLWHPLVLGLALAALGVAASLAVRSALREASP